MKVFNKNSRFAWPLKIFTVAGKTQFATFKSAITTASEKLEASYSLIEISNLYFTSNEIKTYMCHPGRKWNILITLGARFPDCDFLR